MGTEDENRLWIRDNSGNPVEVDGVWARDFSGTAHEIGEIWIRDLTGTPVQVYPHLPGADNPQDGAIWRQDHYCEWCQFNNPGTSDYPQWYTGGSSVALPELIEKGEGLNKALWFFTNYGQDPQSFATEYTRYKWLQPGASATNDGGEYPLNKLEWGSWGTIIRRVPNINSLTESASNFIERIWVRPATINSIDKSGGWDSATNAIVWDQEVEEIEDVQSIDIDRALNINRLSNTLEYFEFESQGNKGVENQLLSFNLPNSCQQTGDILGYFNMRGTDGFSDLIKPIQFRSDVDFNRGSYTSVNNIDTVPHVKLDNSGSPADRTAKWVVITNTNWNTSVEYGTTNNRAYCGQNSNASIWLRNFPCNKDKDVADEYSTHKEIIVALVANKTNGTGSAYDFAANYNGDADDANFFAESNGSVASDRWHTWDGDGQVFLFVRYRTSCFGKYHHSGNPFLNEVSNWQTPEPVIKEFWIQPKAWKYVNGTGLEWNASDSNDATQDKFIGMVLDTIPTTYSDVCSGYGRLTPEKAAFNLPKYFFWNVPLDKCDPNFPPGGTALVGFDSISSSGMPTNKWCWGTSIGSEGWSGTTGRQDLIGAGVYSWESGFDPNPTANQYLAPDASYEFKLLQFNKDWSSMDGFPYGVGHAWGGDILSPGPWCPCTISPAYDTSSGFDSSDPDDPGWTNTNHYGHASNPCPCGESGNDDWRTTGGTTLLYANNSNMCCTPTAQPTSVYMIRMTEANQDWSESDWATYSNSAANIIWSNCSNDQGYQCQACAETSPFCGNWWEYHPGAFHTPDAEVGDGCNGGGIAIGCAIESFWDQFDWCYTAPEQWGEGHPGWNCECICAAFSEAYYEGYADNGGTCETRAKALYAASPCDCTTVAGGVFNSATEWLR